MSQRLIDKVLNATPEERSRIFVSLTDDEKLMMAQMLDAELKNPWARWENDPVGFVEDGLKETLWSKQKEILTSIVHNKRTVVPACHARANLTRSQSGCLVDFRPPTGNRHCYHYRHDP